MNDKTSGRSSYRRGALLLRMGALAAIAAGTVVLIAAYSSGGSATAGTSGTGQKPLAFARCMRSHGEPDFPDPASGRTFNVSQINIDAPQYHSALSACSQFRTDVQLQLSAAQQQGLIKKFLKMTACMRSHGLPDFPDPITRGLPAGTVGFVIPRAIAKSPLLPSAQQACTPS